MDIFKDVNEFTHMQMMQRVLEVFEGRPNFQRLVRLGLLAELDYSDDVEEVTADDIDAYDDWVHGRNNSRRSQRLSDSGADRAFSGSSTRSSSSGYQLQPHCYTAGHELPHTPSVKVQAKESDAERRARLLQEAQKGKRKTEKKRLKKQKQKERKRLEKLEKEKQNPVKNEEEKDDTQQTKAEESKPVNDKSTSSVKELASAKDIDSSEDESSDDDSDSKNDSGDSEELDMASSFVNKAALIARRKLEQKPKPERKEKKKIPVKEEPKPVPEKPNDKPRVEKKSAAPSSTAFEDNLKISTELGNLGNSFASAGNFNMAIKYFTDAIKYNPTEYKLFGNRSFCFEKMQEYTKALTDAELSLSICPGWVKGLFRKGRALAGLKRYDEAAQALMEVLKLDSSCAEAALELKRVEIIQLMEYGFTLEQSSEALSTHGTVKKALEVLSKLHHRPGANQNGTRPPAQVANVSGVSPVLSANTNIAPAQSQDPKAAPQNKPLGPVQNMSNVRSQPKPAHNQAMSATKDNTTPQELFPVWVGNLMNPVSDTVITNLFSKAGVVHSVKGLTYKRCAFVNFTKQEYCDEAIRRFHGTELHGNRIAVRYPDRIPHGMGISRSALKAHNLQDENAGQNDYVEGRNAVGSRRPFRPYRPFPDYRGNQKN
ncbi:Tetratricopeptide repeat protein 31 [Larimichthys crocea]|uniref:Tetratricopeptide repeat protein 31 n=1 Tax=Larimichthys crocea TaxID=215358 RepID=A0A6G0HIZ6_LARCR|nr:Tetratricopeptide repeat protein 31 [Larimichthys crocea]